MHIFGYVSTVPVGAGAVFFIILQLWDYSKFNIAGQQYVAFLTLLSFCNIPLATNS
nr:MAG TPA: hypothetical protein [Caudoviricetes sp.]